MSVVTNLILSTGSIDADKETDVLKVDLGNGQAFKPTWKHGESYGGSRMMEGPVYMAAVNYAIMNGIREQLMNIDWVRPEYVQLFIRCQGYDTFEYFEVFPGKFIVSKIA